MISIAIPTILMAFLSMTTFGVVSGATVPIPFEYDRGTFEITDVSLKSSSYSTEIIGFIKNVDPMLNTIDGVSLTLEMYDKNNHLIGVETAYPVTRNFTPDQKSPFKFSYLDKEDDLDHIYIGILATDWGSAVVSSNESVSPLGNYSSDRPFIGIVGLGLTPDISKQIGLNQTKGLLLTSITEESPADKSGLRGGSNTTEYNGREINVGGDIILKIDNREVSFMHDIITYVQSHKQVGDKIHFTILRDNAIRELDLILGEMPSQPAQNGDSNYPEELYDECVVAAGKSFCDFLFKR